ncbi:hypothetical protein Hanom_Chr06g00477491 [Helianthus anomalus]
MCLDWIAGFDDGAIPWPHFATRAGAWPTEPQSNGGLQQLGPVTFLVHQPQTLLCKLIKHLEYA